MYIKVSLTDLTRKKPVRWKRVFSNFVIYNHKNKTTSIILEASNCIIDETIELMQNYLSESFTWKTISFETSMSLDGLIDDEFYSFMIVKDHEIFGQYGGDPVLGLRDKLLKHYKE